ncbi:MAG: hypothetical protein HY243_00390 [Proteobacteria bacterium]|nr:hypothetical protein [Pseudomonadota bacterium]
MKWPSLFKWRSRRKPPSLTECPKCGKEMVLIEKTTMTGNDMRTYRCEDCREEHVVNFGTALWKILSDARDEQ